MESCYFKWKLYFGVFLVVKVIMLIQGQQQQFRKSPYTLNITLVPFSVQQYHPYNQQYNFNHNNRASRNITASPNINNNPVPASTSFPLHHQQQQITPTYQPQHNPVIFNNQEHFDEYELPLYSSHQATEIRREENLRRDVRNSTAVTHLPAEGPYIAKEKTRILTHHINPSSGTLAEDLRGSTQDIIFPDSFENLFDPITRLDTMPHCARGALFCEDIPTYPYHQIRDSLRRTNVNADLFFDDVVDSPKEIANRISGTQEKFICKSVERTIYPKVGVTKRNKWKYIINQNQEGYIQGVRVETCLLPDRPCDLFEHMPLGIVTACKQKYVTRRMMSLTDDGVPLPDIFVMPSACCCSYRMEDSLLGARNADTTPIPVV